MFFLHLAFSPLHYSRKSGKLHYHFLPCFTTLLLPLFLRRILFTVMSSLCRPFRSFRFFSLQYIDISIISASIYCVAVFINILGHKIFHRVFREKFLELVVGLPGQGLIVRYDQSGLVQGGDDVGHGEGLAGAGHAQ